MPVTPRARRLSSTGRHGGSASKDEAKLKSPNPHESTSVQDRIRQWQAQGAADAPAPDAVSVRSIPLSHRDNSRSRPQSRNEDAPQSAPARRTGRWVNNDKDINIRELRSSSAPRKRVISDEHWKTRKEEKTKRSSRTEERQQPRTSRYDLSYTSTHAREEREERRERLRRSRHAKENGEQLVQAESLDGQDSGIDQDLAEKLGSPVPDYDSRSQSSIQPEEGYGRQRRRSKYAETLGRSGTVGSDEESNTTRTKKGRIFSKTKEIFTKVEPTPVQSNRLPSIEAWLDEQPDPFVETPARGDSTPVEIPQPLRKRSKRPKKKSDEGPSVDPNNIWESVTRAEDPPRYEELMETPQRRRSRSTREDDIRNSYAASPGNGNDGTEDSPTGLRRRGARAHRSPLTDSRQASAEKGSPLNSSAAASPVERPRNRIHRPCPPTGTRPLATIASVETFKERSEAPAYDEVQNPASCDLKRKLTTHEDLMSVLSLPRTGKSVRGARSVRRKRHYDVTSASQVLENLVADEEKYGRELKTLVDGVIPVLLQCVLSKTDSIAAAGLFTSSACAKDDLNFTRPIIDMGIALERLKSFHSRIPLHSVDALLAWAQTAQKAYADFLAAWRLGFQDVVVNLAPLDESRGNADQGMTRDADGDVVNAEGKKVDVAYLLKRPLVRVKNLAKTFDCIKDQSKKPLAKEVSQIFSDLTAMARRRHQEEQGRLEDEAAGNLDAMRARDIRTMAATAGASIDKSRKVRARDCFNLTLYHSTGQRMDCRIEIILRDNQPGEVQGGDILICELDDTGKWLLFPPVELNSVSARRGEDGVDLVVMVRGPLGFGREWQELLALKTEDPQASGEWLTMLGSNPLPPKLNRSPSFVNRGTKDGSTQAGGASPDAKSFEVPGPTEMDVPIGEPSVIGSPEGKSSRPASRTPMLERFLPRLNLGGGLQKKPAREYPLPAQPVRRKQVSSVASIHSSDRSTISDTSMKELPRLPKSSSAPTTPKHHSTGKITALDLDLREGMSDGNPTGSMSQPVSPTPTRSTEGSPTRQRGNSSLNERMDPERHLPSATKMHPAESPESLKVTGSPMRPDHSRTLSSTPSRNLPIVAKIRGPRTQEDANLNFSLNESIRDQWNALSGNGRSRESRSEHKKESRSQRFTEDVPSVPVHSTRRPVSETAVAIKDQSGPKPPEHRDMSILQPRPSNIPTPDPQLKPTPRKDITQKRRSSSPLKHEYAPSSASGSDSDYDTESISDSSSETSEEFVSERDDMPTPLVPVTVGNRRLSKAVQAVPDVPKSTGTRTLAPSDSASQAPYRSVPPSSTIPTNKQSRPIALVCSWSNKGMWEQVFPDECSIVISPGLIEAFEMSAAHSGTDAFGIRHSDPADSRTSSLTQQPIVAFELTPIVPLRRGTALDISIRSPPTANSKLKTTNNVMFRSRNADECEALYGMINWARCNNPTYIRLQNARPRQPSVTFNLGESQQNSTRSGSWFSFGASQRKSSYRASSAPVPASASIGGSDASAGTMTSAFSALKRLGVSSAFNLNRSSVIRKNGPARGGGSLYSSSTETRTESGSSTPARSQLGQMPGKDGPNVPATSAAAANGGGMINNMKIRLYLRKGQHWENLGAGRLSVLPAEDKPPTGSSGSVTPTRLGSSGASASAAASASGQALSTIVGQPGQMRTPRLPSSSHTPHRVHGGGREKRILITKNKEVETVLLDAVLGESCFERIMQTGIAVKVWTEDEVIGVTGGVVMGREKIYMLQLPGTKEAGWVFQMCGTYRYGE